MINVVSKTAKWKMIALLCLMVITLFMFRMLWITAFQSPDQPYVSHGQLDLRAWNAAEHRTISLDGEWEFYPHTWLMGSEHPGARYEQKAAFLQVPGNWNQLMKPGKGSPYGYGSYRLRISVNPKQRINYSIRIPSVRSSSSLYVNGRLLYASGKPGDSKEKYVPLNLPYTSTFTADDSGNIDVIIEAANYEDPRESGIVRSIKFGTEKGITREVQLSIAMQQLAAVVFLMHAGYAFILYIVGNRDKRLLYFSLLGASAMMMQLLGSDEKLLSFWLPINYEWGFKLVHLSMIGIAYSLLQCIKLQLPKWIRRALPWFAVICAGAGLFAALLPVRYLVGVQPLYGLLTGASILITIVSMLRTSIKGIQENAWLLLSLVAFTSNFAWWAYFLASGIKVVYYPFDLIVSMACFVAVWFREYFQVHAETKRLASKLQKADKLKDEFLANTSHELRNPLHSILNISQAVLEREQKSLHESSIKDLGVVLTVGRRMSLMLNDLLDVMSLKEGNPHLQLRHFSLQTIVTGVMDMLRFMTEGKAVELVNRIPEHFPLVVADENRVIQILFNLIHNALKFTDEGEVSIAGYVKDGLAHIVVADTGIGMDKETIRRVFEPYEQGEAGKTLFEGGFGLGLSISKKLVELHGGALRVKSAPGEGSEFTFTLRLVDETASSPQVETFTGQLAAKTIEESAAAQTDDKEGIESISVGDPLPPHSAERPRILIVDDDPVNLKVLESLLSLEQYDIMTVTSGKKALETLDLKEWDLLISDVMMPQMSGYELTRKIRQRFTVTELPILLLTARSQPEDIENGFLVGANDYVTKPVDALEIRSRVKALTGVKQSVNELLRMEAAWLQAQIQPHFLFNTLSAVAALSEVDLDQMRHLLDVFGDFLRDKFKLQNKDELAPIEEELSIVRSYLYIEQVRFDDRLKVVWEVDDCEDLKIPMLTIQPLVENAVRHGVMKRSRGGTIVIRVTDHGAFAEITVEDNGVGMEETVWRRLLQNRSDSRSGVGLLNTDLRLKRRYGKGLQIRSEPGQGTSISFVVNKPLG